MRTVPGAVGGYWSPGATGTGPKSKAGNKQEKNDPIPKMVNDSDTLSEYSTHISHPINPSRNPVFAQLFGKIIGEMIAIARDDVVRSTGVVSAHFHYDHFYLSF